MAPEAIFCTEENSTFDSWSFGCILYELIFGKPLFLKAKGIQQLGSMIFLLFREKFNEINLPGTVTKNLIENDPLLSQSVEELRECLRTLRD